MEAAETLVLLHGFTHTGTSWEHVRAGLGERYRPLTPDLRGHGSASDMEPVDLQHVVDDVGALTREPFSLVGYSMGGRIALHVALSLGSRVRSLALIGAGPGIADPEERAERRAADQALAERIERMSIEDFAHQWAQTPVLAGLPPDVLAEVHADRMRSRVDGLARALRGLGTGSLPSLWDRLGELQMEVTMIVGGRDEKFRAIAERMAARLTRARLEVVPGAGHAVHLENPQRVAALIDGP